MLVNNYSGFTSFHRKKKMQPAFFSICLFLALLSVQSADSSGISETPTSVDPSANSSYRSRRNADPLSPLVENTQRLARLINGISLEIGLINGSIPTDDVISEFLHMDSLKPKDIIGLDSKLIGTALAELDSLHGQVKVSGEVTKIQNRLILLNEVREESGFMKEFFTLNGSKAYEKALEQIGSTLSNQNQSQSLLERLKKLETIFTDYKKMNESMDSTEATYALSVFSIQIRNFEDMQKEVEKSGDFLAELQDLKQLKNSSSFFNLLSKESDLRKKLGDMVFTSKTDLGPVTQNFQTVFGAWSKLSAAFGSFTTISSLISSRSKRIDYSVQFTGGLPRGKTDLDSLNSDSANSWIVERINNSSIVTASLKKAFTKFDDFIRELGNVEDKWNVVDQGSNRKSLDSIMSLMTLLSSVNDQSAEITTLVTNLYQCESTTNFPSTDSKKVELLQKNVTALNKLIDSINDFSQIEELKNMSEIIDILKESRGQTNDPVKLANEIIRKLRANKKYQEVSTIVKKLDSYGSNNNHDKLIAMVDPLANSILDNYISLGQYHDALNVTRYFDFFVCLERIEDKGSLLTDSMDLVEKVQLPDQVFTEAKTTINSILGSQSDLAHFQDSAKNLKKVEIREALGLKPNFPNSLETSQNLSSAVQGFATIKNLHDQRSSWQSLGQNLKNQKKPNGWSKTDDARIQELGQIKADLDNTLAGVDQFLTELKNSKIRRRRSGGYRRPRNSTAPLKKAGFKSLGDVLKAAEQIPKVSWTRDSLEKVKTTVDKIKTATSDKIVAALNELEKLNLDFSSFGFSSSVPSLAAIDLFFTSYGRQMATVPKVKTPPSLFGNQTAPSGPAEVIVVTETPPSTSGSVVLSIIIVGGIVAVILIGVGVYFWVFKEKEEHPLPQKKVGKDLALYLLTQVVRSIERGSSEYKRLPTHFSENILKGLNDIGDLYVDNEKVQDNRFEKRYPHIICKTATMPQLTGFENPFINANEMRIGEKFWIMTQAPQDGTEQQQNEKEGVLKRDTREKFWAMIDQKTVGVIGQLCNFMEENIIKCSKYYSDKLNGEMTFGRYTVKTIGKETNLRMFTDRKAFTLYTIQYTNSLEPAPAKPKTTKLLHYSAWPDHGSPIDPAPAVEMIRFFDGQEGNVLIHCSAGIGRTGSLMCIKYGIKLCQERKVEDLADVMKPVRACRYRAIQTQDQVTYVMLCIAKSLMDIYKVPYLRDYDAMYYYHERNAKNMYDTDGLNDKQKKDFILKRLGEDRKKVEEYCQKKKEEYEKNLKKEAMKKAR